MPFFHKSKVVVRILFLVHLIKFRENWLETNACLAEVERERRRNGWESLKDLMEGECVEILSKKCPNDDVVKIMRSLNAFHMEEEEETVYETIFFHILNITDTLNNVYRYIAELT